MFSLLINTIKWNPFQIVMVGWVCFQGEIELLVAFCWECKFDNEILMQSFTTFNCMFRFALWSIVVGQCCNSSEYGLNLYVLNLCWVIFALYSVCESEVWFWWREKKNDKGKKKGSLFILTYFYFYFFIRNLQFYFVINAIIYTELCIRQICLFIIF